MQEYVELVRRGDKMEAVRYVYCTCFFRAVNIIIIIAAAVTNEVICWTEQTRWLIVVGAKFSFVWHEATY